MLGSSPLTRGKPPRRVALPTPGGLIPAHAGKTVHLGQYAPNQGAHPRSRGENMIVGRSGPSSWGSSPLTRGKQLVGDELSAVLGLIPAHAGKTGLLERYAVPLEAHPRSRGENAGSNHGPNHGQGSSPLTRGKPIPSLFRRRARLAHPRSRGENHAALTAFLNVSGSSPLTRGKRRPEGEGRRRGGLIPAHAGKTVRSALTVRPRSAHPRSRGENHTLTTLPRCSTGSSPLTRGKRRPAPPVRCRSGLIPAHAGKTRSCGWTCGRRGAHPRSRGENPSQSGGLRGLAGLIPAHAGKTP